MATLNVTVPNVEPDVIFYADAKYDYENMDYDQRMHTKEENIAITRWLGFGGGYSQVTEMFMEQAKKECEEYSPY